MQKWFGCKRYSSICPSASGVRVPILVIYLTYHYVLCSSAKLHALDAFTDAYVLHGSCTHATQWCIPLRYIVRRSPTTFSFISKTSALLLYALDAFTNACFELIAGHVRTYAPCTTNSTPRHSLLTLDSIWSPTLAIAICLMDARSLLPCPALPTQSPQDRPAGRDAWSWKSGWDDDTNLGCIGSICSCLHCDGPMHKWINPAGRSCISSLAARRSSPTRHECLCSPAGAWATVVDDSLSLFPSCPLMHSICFSTNHLNRPKGVQCHSHFAPYPWRLFYPQPRIVTFITQQMNKCILHIYAPISYMHVTT